MLWRIGAATALCVSVVACSSLESSPCKLPVADSRGDVAIGGWPRIESRMKAVGDVVASVIMVDFSDAPATMSPEEALSKIGPAESIFTEVSYGRMKFVLSPQLEWYRMSRPSTAYAPLTKSFDNHRAYVAEAVALADPEVDFSGSDAVIVLANPDAVGIGEAGPAFTPISTDEGVEADGTVLMNGATSAHDINTWGPIWLNHELTHALGLVDLYAFAGDEQFPYTGEFSYMGMSSLDANAPGLLAWERWVLGWIDDDQVTCLPSAPASPTRYELSAIGTIGGPKAVVVALGDNRVLVIEARLRGGLDANLRKSGLLVYTVDTSVESGLGPVRVFPPDPVDPAVGYTTYFDSPRAVGESITVDGISVTNRGSTVDGFTVDVVAAS